MNSIFDTIIDAVMAGVGSAWFDRRVRDPSKDALACRAFHREQERLAEWEKQEAAARAATPEQSACSKRAPQGWKVP